MNNRVARWGALMLLACTSIWAMAQAGEAPTDISTPGVPVETVAAHATSPRRTWAPVQVGVWYSDQLLPAEADVYGLRLCLPGARNHDVNGIDVGVVTRTDGCLRGLQLGIVNCSGAMPVAGEQTDWFDLTMPGEKSLAIAAAFHPDPGKCTDGIAVGLLNAHLEQVRGLQIGGINGGRVLRGLEVGAGANACETVSGGQFCASWAGFGANSAVAMSGVQAVVTIFGVNVAKQAFGLQVNASIGVNMADDMRGVQVGLILNGARRLRGLQIGLVNRAEDMKGVQIGLVNSIPQNSVPMLPLINARF